MDLARQKNALVLSGFMWGQQAALEVAGDGQHLVHSMNESTGRTRWSQTLKINYLKNQFVVIDLTFGTRDTIDLEIGGGCEVNFLTGQATRNGAAFPASASHILVTDWNEELLPKACQF